MMLRTRLTAFITVTYLFGYLSGVSLNAESHIVTTEELAQAVGQKSTQRQENLEKIRGFFQSEKVIQTLEKTPVDLEQVQESIPFLDDAELAMLASQVDSVDDGIEAGALTNQQITYILIALATAVIILVIVAA